MQRKPLGKLGLKPAGPLEHGISLGTHTGRPNGVGEATGRHAAGVAALVRQSRGPDNGDLVINHSRPGLRRTTPDHFINRQVAQNKIRRDTVLQGPGSPVTRPRTPSVRGTVWTVQSGIQSSSAFQGVLCEFRDVPNASPKGRPALCGGSFDSGQTCSRAERRGLCLKRWNTGPERTSLIT